MKKIITVSILASALWLGSCVKTDININPKGYQTTKAEYLLSEAQKNLSDIMSSANVNRNVFRIIAQHWTETTYTDESRYNFTNRSIPDNFWTAIYRDVLKSFYEAKKIVKADKSITDAKVRDEKLATIDVQECYAYYVLTSTFGDVPYKEAMNIDNPQPKYDKSIEILKDLITRLKKDANDLTYGSGNSFGGADLIYGGDNSHWEKFANSLMVKIGMLLKDVDPALSKSTVEAAVANVFTSNGDNAKFNYLPTTPNTNPVWEDLVQSGRNDFVVTETLLSYLDSTYLGAGNLDPRLPVFANLSVDTPIYVGGIYGDGNSDGGDVSFPGDAIKAETFPGILLSYSEIALLLAEAAEAGYNVGGTAQSFYEAGVKANMAEWGVSPAAAAAYLALPAVDYSSSTGTAKQKLAVQNWLGLYNRGFEAWTQWRRLDYPNFVPPPGISISEHPMRLTYPVIEQNLNSGNYAAAAASVGGDKLKTKLFWDKF